MMDYPDNDDKVRESLRAFERMVIEAERIDKLVKEDVSNYYEWAVDRLAKMFFGWMWEASKIRGRSDSATGYALSWVLDEAISIAQYYCNPTYRLNQKTEEGLTLDEHRAKYGVLVNEGTLPEWQAKRKENEAKCEKEWIRSESDERAKA